MSKKAFVSGCFDMLHSGHVAFFEEAAKYGHLYVAIGSDANVFSLKNRPTINSQAERLYMIKSLSYVKDAFVAKGSGVLDFVEELKAIKPDVFIVNEDGSTPEKKKLCAELGIEYVVLKREPHTGLEVRSTTALRAISTIPESIDLAGGLLSHPRLSSRAAGPALTVSIYPLLDEPSSTRAAAIELWGARLPVDRSEKLAKILFGYSNLPGTKEFRGSSQAIGITFAGLTRADYAGEYWPTSIRPVLDENTHKFMEDVLYIIPLEPDPLETGMRDTASLESEAARALARASEICWQALHKKDVASFGHSLLESFDVEARLFPTTLASQAAELIETYREQALGWKICHAGAQACLLLVSRQPIGQARKISIRRASD